jgi:Resolvase, N terminal domain
LKPPGAYRNSKATARHLERQNFFDEGLWRWTSVIKSQASEGWRLVKTRYDDGGISGESMERAALQQLLGHIRQGLIEVVVVYKVDRLTRSLADFAKISVPVPQPLEDPLRGMLLLGRLPLIFLQDRVNDPTNGSSFGRAGGRLRRYPGGTENASIFATVRGSIPNRRAASRRLIPSTYTARRTCPYSSTPFIPPPSAHPGRRPSAAGLLLRRCGRSIRPLQLGIFSPTLSPTRQRVMFEAFSADVREPRAGRATFRPLAI